MFENYSDDQLFELIKNGNKDAFDTFFLRQYPILCTYAVQFIDIEDGKDIVQDVMLWMWENRKQLEIHGEINSYLFIAIKNRCLTLINRSGIKSQVHSILYLQKQKVLSEPNPYVIKELQNNIDKAINNLPVLYREVFIMNRYKGMTYKQIADSLSISSKTVDYRIQQALKKLRDSLHEYLKRVD